MRDMQRMEIVLTSEQLRQVEELKKKDQVNSPFLKRLILFFILCMYVCVSLGGVFALEYIEGGSGVGLGEQRSCLEPHSGPLQEQEAL